MSAAIGKTKTEGITIREFGQVANHTNTLNKTVKVFIPALDIVTEILGFFPAAAGAKAGIEVLGKKLGTTKKVLNATNILERGHNWGTAKSGEGFLKKWEKAAKMVVLTVAQFLEPVLLVDECTLRFFAQEALKFCGIPILKLVKDCLYLTTAVLGIIIAGQEISKARSDLDKFKEKKRKWEWMTSAALNSGDLQQKYAGKANGQYSKNLRDSIGAKEEEIADYKDLGKRTEHKKKRKKYRAKLRVAQKELKRLNRKDKKVKDVTKFENYVTAIDNANVEKIRQHKIDIYETRMANCRKTRKKSWLLIAVDIGKIVMISLGTLLAAFSAANPVLESVVVKLTTSSLSLGSNILALIKNLYVGAGEDSPYKGFGPKTVKDPEFKLNGV